MKRIIALLIASAVIVSACATGTGPRKAHYPNSVTPEIKAQFDAADALYRSRRFAEADAAFGKFITELPYTELTDEARFRRGEIAFANSNYSLALSFYRQSVAEISSPSIAPKAHFKSALTLHKLKQPSETLKELGRIDRRSASAILRLRMDSLGVLAQKALGANANQAIMWNLFILDDHAELQGVLPQGLPPDEITSEAAASAEVHRWIDDRSVPLDDIKTLPFKAMKGKQSGGYATYKLALTLVGEGDTKAAERQLKSYITTYPKHEYYGNAQLLLSEVGGATGKGAGISIGVILPLTGRHALFGESVLNGIECGVGVFSPCTGPAGMKILMRDSESAAGGAVGAVNELAEEGVIAIVGPLESSGAPDAAKRAQELGIPLISLSQREGVAEIGDYVFRNSSSSSSEMKTLADYAVTNLRLKRFFILYPSSKKGAEYKTLFANFVNGLGGSVVSSQSYSPKLVSDVDELRGRGAVELAQSENSQGPVFAVPEAKFDAVFIPDVLPLAAAFAEKIALESSQPFTLLGISRWDDQKHLGGLGPQIENAVFTDSFYRGAIDAQVAAFISNFTSAYGSEPTLLEALGYDATKLIVNAVEKRGAVHRDSVRDVLAKISDFPGVTGKITFNSQGDAIRRVWVFTIKGGEIVAAKQP